MLVVSCQSRVLILSLSLVSCSWRCAGSIYDGFFARFTSHQTLARRITGLEKKRSRERSRLISKVVAMVMAMAAQSIHAVYRAVVVSSNGDHARRNHWTLLFFFLYRFD